MYGKDNIIDLQNPMMRGLAFHRASALKSYVNYAMMTTSDLLGRADEYDPAVNATISLMEDTNYQRIFVRGESRPLLFVLYARADLNRFFGGDLSKLKASVDAIRNAGIERQLGNPYIVIVSSPAKEAELVRSSLGADGISEYVSGRRNGKVQNWADFEPSIEADWDEAVSAGTGDAIPNLRSGADIRARCQFPPPFEHRFPDRKCDAYVINPTLKELETEFRRAATWTEIHKDRDPARLLLIYSWSECDESANCLMPTIGDPSGENLRAIANGLMPNP
jgi:hypothetical protein